MTSLLVAAKIQTIQRTAKKSKKKKSGEGAVSFLKCQKSFTEMSKYFTENFAHGDEAILREKWAISGLGEALPDEKSGRKRRRIAHTSRFCAGFSLKFCSFSRFCKHEKFSKVNAKFSKVVDFFFSSKPFFCQNQVNKLAISQLANPQKTGFFSSKSCFRGKLSKYGGQKRPFCQFCSKKMKAFSLQRKELFYTLTGELLWPVFLPFAAVATSPMGELG